ncbi:MAG: hypothetical protein ACT4PG_03390, partial [Panacagrimonas sp.]
IATQALGSAVRHAGRIEAVGADAGRMQASFEPEPSAPVAVAPSSNSAAMMAASAVAAPIVFSAPIPAPASTAPSVHINGKEAMDWRTPVHKPVAQQNMQAGAVELF